MPAQRRSESTISTGTTRWNLKAGQLSVHSCILLIVAWICCLLSITQKKVQVTRPCHICGSLRVLSRNADLKRHIKTHDSDPTRFVLLFSNLLIIVIDTSYRKLPCPYGMVASTELFRSSIWKLTDVGSVYYYYSLISFLPLELTDPFSLAPEIRNLFVTTIR